MPRAERSEPALTLQSIFFKKETHDSLEDASWTSEKNMSQLVRDGIAELLEDPSKLGEWGEDPGAGPHHFHLRVSVEAWDELGKLARKLRYTRSAVARIVINHVAGVKS